MTKNTKLRNLLLTLGTTTMLVAPIALVSCSDKDNGGDIQPPIDPGGGDDGGGTKPPTPEKKPVINLVNKVIDKKITEDLPNGSGVPGFKLGFGVRYNPDDLLSNYDLDQVYNFSATISVDTYKISYTNKGFDSKRMVYDVPAMETTLNFNFKFNGDQGLLQLEGSNPDYHVGIAPPISNGADEFKDAILSRPLGNSFKTNNSNNNDLSQQLQFQAGMGGNYFEGQNIFIWPMSDENVADKEKFLLLTNSDLEDFNKDKNMSMTYSLTPVTTK